MEEATKTEGRELDGEQEPLILHQKPTWGPCRACPTQMGYQKATSSLTCKRCGNFFCHHHLGKIVMDNTDGGGRTIEVCWTCALRIAVQGRWTPLGEWSLSIPEEKQS